MSHQWVYIEYPRTLHGPHGATVSVVNDEEKAAKLAEGWTLKPWDGDTRPTDEPYTPEAVQPAEPEPEPAALYEADAEIAKKWRRGRKAKSED